MDYASAKTIHCQLDKAAFEVIHSSIIDMSEEDFLSQIPIIDEYTKVAAITYGWSSSKFTSKNDGYYNFYAISSCFFRDKTPTKIQK